MSKRVTTETEIRDRSIAVEAFKAAGIRFEEHGSNKFTIRTGSSVGTINLTTGLIEGDDMSFRKQDFDVLKQHYAEQKYLWELKQRGASIHTREVDHDGNIVITYQIA